MKKISLSDDLFNYLQQNVENPDAFVASLIQQWRQQKEQEKLAEACEIIDQLELGWTEEWQQATITEWEAFSL